tara:strand:- start:394 stop:882 length:489 start_codon:yes stop_codon:yes gene_type:complete
MKRQFKEIREFLDKESFNKIKNFIYSNDFPWYYKEEQTPNNDHYFFSHIIYEKHQPKSLMYNSIIPILDNLNCQMVSEIRANLLLKENKQYSSNYHCDRNYNCNTAIFYINNNNGYTLLGKKEKIKIKCEENKMLIFNSQFEHCAVSQTNENKRIVINFNYI